MRKVLLFSILSIALFACGGGNSPEGTVKKVFDLYKQGKIQEARPYFNDVHSLFFDMFEEGSKEVTPQALERIKAKFQNYKVVEGKTTINGDEATVSYTDDKGEEGTLPLKLIDGVWILQVTPTGW
ncbi:hypothetical protein LJB98_04915 [Bacteroidales bacterium OttesenSCG-928-M11]|nr:hypothetical protein [Bacteroidales bacterium OttesenSCG-928-M11]